MAAVIVRASELFCHTFIVAFFKSLYLLILKPAGEKQAMHTQALHVFYEKLMWFDIYESTPAHVPRVPYELRLHFLNPQESQESEIETPPLDQVVRPSAVMRLISAKGN